MTNTDTPEIQLIANLVVRGGDGRVLLVKRAEEEDRWWLPGDDLRAYEHPEEAAERVLRTLFAGDPARPVLKDVESFRGRRGWHVVFDYLVETAEAPVPGAGAAWHDPAHLPPTAHGRWEEGVVKTVLGSA